MWGELSLDPPPLMRFFFLMEIENLKDLSEKLDSIIDFSSNIEYESLDLLKLAFFDFFKRSERAEAPASRDELTKSLKKNGGKTMQVWEKV